MRDVVRKMAIELGVCGLMNVQLAYQDDEIYVIEVNPSGIKNGSLRLKGGGYFTG